MDKTNIMAYFCIFGDEFDIDTVTRLLNLEPDEIRIKGIIPAERKRPAIETRWKISTGYEESYDASIQLEKILTRLNGKQEQLKILKVDNHVEFLFQLVIGVENGEVPGMHFNAQQLAFISDIDAEIDIDLYVYS